jgi:hypothetical protein
MTEIRLDIGKVKASRPREGLIPNPKLKLPNQSSEVMRFEAESDVSGGWLGVGVAVCVPGGGPFA